MATNSETLTKFFNIILEVGSQIASRKYISLILNGLIEQNKETSDFLKYITLGEELNIDPMINTINRLDILTPINNIYDHLFFETSKALLLESCEKPVLDEFIQFGLDV